MPENPSSLEYQPKDSFHRSYVRRFLPWVAILVALTAAAFVFPESWQKLKRERWERAKRARLLSTVLNDSASPETAAFEEDNTKALALFNLPDHALFKQPLTDAYGARRRLLALAKLDPRLDAIDGHPMTRQHSILFAHQRRTPAGQPRLVVVEGIVNWETFSPGITHLLPLATTFVIDAPGPTPLKPTSESEGPMIESPLAKDPPWGVRVFAGQLDPADASHFWINYETSDGTKGIIDGWLRQLPGATGMKDEVELKLR